mmetsp:Transcript_17118/g.65314  ORF Transcript_17118/g.65314 Transcript_17118/m.65314 type:complete len:224 (-) Transcript_17118:223-894(-)
MRFSKRRRMAASISQGTFVAASTSTPEGPPPTPCICTRNSVLILLEDSDSPSERCVASESISSMNTMDGACCLAISKRLRTSFSDSPCHLLTRSEELTAKKVASASVATALARYDLPVPGGPYSRMPRQGFRFPTKRCGKRAGRMTASFKASLAASRPATSSQRTLGFSVTMALPRADCRRCASSSFLAASSFLAMAAPPLAGAALGGCSPFSMALRSSARFM